MKRTIPQKLLILPCLLLAMMVHTLAQGAAWVTTDLPDYAPGSVAQITGGGYQPGETVELQVLRIDINENSGPEHNPWQVTADASGGFSTSWYVTQDEVGATLQLTATGLTSGLTAQATFTDGDYSTVAVGSQSGSFTYGSVGTATFSISLSGKTGGNTVSVDLTISGLPSGATAKFTPNNFTASASSTSSTLTVTNGAATPAGTYTITVTDTIPGSSGTGTLTIGKATPTVTVNVGSYTYNGSPQGPNTVTTPSTGTVTYSYVGVSGTTYGPSATRPTSAGSYTVTATVAADANYNSASSSATAFSITKATPTISVSNSPVTYDGTGKAATVTGSVAGTASSILTGGSATKTNAGTYAVTANFAPTDTTNYNSLTAASAGNFVISQVTPTISVNNSPVTYDGTGKAATVSASVAGSVSSILTGGSATKTNAGTYAVTANFTPTDTTNYSTLTAAAAGNFIINKATPTATLAVNNSPVTYDGSAKAATVTISASSVAGATANILTGGAASQTIAGTYAVTANFVPTDSTNYNTLTAQSAGNFVINKATPTISVNNSPVTYDGTGKAATVSGSVAGSAGSILTGGAATQTNAGTYAVTANFTPTDITNYNSLTAAAAGNFIINKATPTATLSVNNSPLTYDGSAKAATVTISASSVPGATANILTGGAASKIIAGTYAVTADFVPTDSANYNTLTAQSAGNFVINKATPTLSVNNSPVTYDNTGKAATVSGSVAGTASSILTGGAATQTNAGTYAVAANFAPTDTTNYNSLTAASAGNFIINKASTTATLVSMAPSVLPGNSVKFTNTLSVVAPGAGTPTGTVQFKTNGVAFGSSVSLSGLVAVSATATLPHGSNTVTAEYAGDSNFSGVTNALAPKQIVNTPPVARAVSSSVAQGGVATINFDLGKYKLATDADADTMTIIAASGATNANLGVAANGLSMTYTNTGGTAGTFDAFSFVVSDGFGGLATNTATVRIESPVGFNQLSVVGNTLNYVGIPGANYAVENTASLSPATWASVMTNTVGTDGRLTFNLGSTPSGFYRTRYVSGP